MVKRPYLNIIPKQQECRHGTTGFKMDMQTNCLSGTVLLVEDEAIIALGTKIMLEGLGADRVLLAGTVAEAMMIAEDNVLTFAMLDIILDQGTCEPIAQLLKLKKVPFVFATGMSDDLPFSAAFPAVPILTKPYADMCIRRSVSILLSQTGDMPAGAIFPPSPAPHSLH